MTSSSARFTSAAPQIHNYTSRPPPPPREHGLHVISHSSRLHVIAVSVSQGSMALRKDRQVRARFKGFKAFEVATLHM